MIRKIDSLQENMFRFVAVCTRLSKANSASVKDSLQFLPKFLKSEPKGCLTNESGFDSKGLTLSFFMQPAVKILNCLKDSLWEGYHFFEIVKTCT